VGNFEKKNFEFVGKKEKNKRETSKVFIKEGIEK